MALRLIEMVLTEKDGADVRKLLEEHRALEHRQIRLPDEEVLVRILSEAERSEAVLDALAERKTPAHIFGAMRPAALLHPTAVQFAFCNSTTTTSIGTSPTFTS